MCFRAHSLHLEDWVCPETMVVQFWFCVQPMQICMGLARIFPACSCSFKDNNAVLAATIGTTAVVITTSLAHAALYLSLSRAAIDTKVPVVVVVVGVEKKMGNDEIQNSRINHPKSITHLVCLGAAPWISYSASRQIICSFQF